MTVPDRFPVTDPYLDAPDGAVVNGYERHGDYWEPLRCQGCEDAPIGQHTGLHDWEPESAEEQA